MWRARALLALPANLPELDNADLTPMLFYELHIRSAKTCPNSPSLARTPQLPASTVYLQEIAIVPRGEPKSKGRDRLLHYQINQNRGNNKTQDEQNDMLR